MTKPMFVKFCLVVVLLLSLGALAQTPDDDPFAEPSPAPSATASLEASPLPSPTASPQGSPKTTFKVTEQSIAVVDRYTRPYLAPENTAWLGVRLATGSDQRCKALQQFKEISAGGQDYAFAEGAEFSRFPLVDGAATVHFVVFSEAGKNPVDYELALFQGEGADAKQTPLEHWSVGQGTLADQTQADVLAPHTREEKLAIGGFALVSLGLLYGLFGRSLFARFLRHKKMEVSGALGWSNLLVLAGALALVAAVLGMWLWPKVLWNKTWSIYAVVIGGYLTLMFATYAGGLLVTRK